MTVDLVQLGKAFDAAASDIERYGWRRGGVSNEDPDKYNPRGTYSRCLWVAVSRALERAKLYHYLATAEDMLLTYFHEPFIVNVFVLNDHFPGPDEKGQAWAVKSLREIAAELCGANAPKSVAEPDTDSTE